MITQQTYQPRRWYLIQRLSPTTDLRRAEKTKLDRYFSCDYMGSAEFEYGALPDSIKLVRGMAAENNLSLREMFIVGSSGKKILTWVVCHSKANLGEVKKFLTGLADNKTRSVLKEPTFYDYLFEPNDNSRILETQGWLVLDESYPLFFFTSELMKTEVWQELTAKGAKTSV